MLKKLLAQIVIMMMILTAVPFAAAETVSLEQSGSISLDSGNVYLSATSDNYIFTASGASRASTDTLSVFDKETLAFITSAQIKQYTSTTLRIEAMHVKGDYLYVVFTQGTSGGDPCIVKYFIKEVGDTLEIVKKTGIRPEGTAYIDDDILCRTDSGYKNITLMNTEDVSNKAAIGTSGENEELVASYTHLYLNGNLLFASTSKTIYIYDATSAKNGVSKQDVQVLKGNITPDSTATINDFKASGSYIYAATTKGTYIIDVSNPESPKKLGTVPSLGSTSAIEINNGYMYASSGDEFYIFSLADGKNPTQIYKNTLTNAYDIHLRPGKIYLSTKSGVLVYNASGIGIEETTQAGTSDSVSSVTFDGTLSGVSGVSRICSDGGYLFALSESEKAVKVYKENGSTFVCDIYKENDGTKLDILNIETKDGYLYVSYDGVYRKYNLSTLETARVEEEVVPLYSDTKKDTSNGVAVSDKYIFVALTEAVREYVANYKIAVFDKTTGEYLTSTWLDTGNASYDSSVRKMWVYGDKLYVSYNDAKTTKGYTGALTSKINSSTYRSPLVRYDISAIEKGAELTPTRVDYNYYLKDHSHPYNRGGSSYYDKENTLLYHVYYASDGSFSYKVRDVSGTDTDVVRTFTGASKDCVEFIVKNGYLYEVLQNNAGLTKSGSTTLEYNQVKVYDISASTAKTVALADLLKGTYQTTLYGDRTILDIEADSQKIYLATTDGVKILDNGSLKETKALLEGKGIYSVSLDNSKLIVSTKDSLYIYDTSDLSAEPVRYNTGTTVRDIAVENGKIYTSTMPQNSFGEVLSFDGNVIKKVNSLKFDEYETQKSYKGENYTLLQTQDGILVYNSTTCLKTAGVITGVNGTENIVLSGKYFYTFTGSTISAYEVPAESKALSDCKKSDFTATAEIVGVASENGLLYVYTKGGIIVLTLTDGTLSQAATLLPNDEISAAYVNDKYIYTASKTTNKVSVFDVADYKLTAEGSLSAEANEIAASGEYVFTTDADGNVLRYKTDDGVVINYNPAIVTPDTKSITVKTEDRGFPYVTYEKRIFSAHNQVKSNDDFVVTAGSGGVAVYDKDLNKLTDMYIKKVSGMYLSDNKIVLIDASSSTNICVYLYEISESGELTQKAILCSGLTAVSLFADGDKIFVYDASLGKVSAYSWNGVLQNEVEGLQTGANKIYYKDGFLYVVSSNMIYLYSEDGTHKATIDAIMAVADLEAIGDYLYTSGKSGTAAQNYLRAFNLANAKAGTETSPAVADSYSTFVAVTGGRIPTFEACGDFLVADAMDSNQLQIVNLKTRDSLYREGFLEKEISATYSDMDISGGKVYCISENGGLFVYNLFATDIADIEFVSDGIVTKTPNGNNTKARIKIHNESGEDFSGKLILAAYKGDEVLTLLDMLPEDVVAQNGVETIVETQAFNIESFNGITVKAFLFDSLESLTPLCSHQVSLEPSKDTVTLYVDSNSKSAIEDGSVDNPYKTIKAAKDRVRQLNKTMSENITVLIAGGRYELTEPLIFNEEDSGFNGFNVIYKAKDGEVPVISGGKKIDGFTLYDEEKGIYVADARGINSRNLNVNGERAVRARSEGKFKNAQINEGELGIYCYNEELLNYKNISDLEVVFCQDWLSKRIGVDAVYEIDSSGKILLTMNRPFWQYQSYSASAIEYYENALELLDAENEFYIDTKEDKVYYKPKSGVDMTKALVFAGVLENLITVEGSGLYKKAQNLSFEGLEFTDTTWMAPTNDGGFFPEQAGRYYGNMNSSNIIYFENNVTDAITVKNAENITIDSCTLKNLGGYGIGITHAANDISVTNNTIRDISAGGVLVGEVNRDEVDPEDLRKHVYNVNVENNYIINTACEYYSSCAVTIGAVQDVNVLHNEIANTPYSAIHIGWGWSRKPARNITGLNVKYNYIHDVVRLLGDGGAIYTTGYTLADSSENPNNLSENFIERVNGTSIFAGAAIYLDTGSCGYLIEKNVIDLRESNSPWVPKWSTGNENNIFRNNYSTTSYTTAKNVSNTTVISYGDAWSSDAASIKNNAGVK